MASFLSTSLFDPDHGTQLGESYEDLDHGGDGSTDAAEPPKEIQSGEVELEHGEVDLEGGEIDESPEDGEDGDENFDPPMMCIMKMRFTLTS